MIGVETRLSSDLSASLDKFAKDVREKVLFSGVAAMAQVIYDEARSNAQANRKTGLLQNSIYRVYSPEKSTDESKMYRISWNKRTAPHGHLIEFGTSRAPAYPFMRPAFDRINEAIAAGKARMAESMDQL